MTWLEQLSKEANNGKPFTLVTIVGTKGSTPRGIGTRLWVKSDGQFCGTIGGGKLEALVLEEARQHLKTQATAKVVRYPLGAECGQCCGGSVEVMFENLNIDPELWLFGAGHVAQALVRVMTGTSFAITVIDTRQEWLNQLPAGTNTYHGDVKDLIRERGEPTARTYALVMTHEHARDEDIIAELAPLPHAYLGLIGSDEKWRRFSDRLLTRGLTSQQLASVRCPIGIGRLGKAPAEVAISVAAELLQTRA